MGMSPILTFEPIFKETVWGGRLLESSLGKKLPADGPVGESWEIVDLPADQSRLTEGESRGVTLEKLVEEQRERLLGDVPLLEGRFPLLLKFIDAQQTLSVQVHPDEKACALLGHGARPKTEAWYIIESRPDAKLYVGLKPGITEPMFAQAIAEGTVDELLHQVKVLPGDFVYLPSGTIHAIGEGILLAEVQQSSNTTFRVFDWNRVGLDGKPRQLHVEQALKSIHFGTAGVPEAPAPASGRAGIACKDFEMEALRLHDGDSEVLTGAGPLILMGIGGTGRIVAEAGGYQKALGIGQTGLVTAESASSVGLLAEGEITVLATRIPSK